MVGSFHTDLAAYTTTLSGSVRLGSLMREYMRWPYGKCVKILAPSSHTRRLLIDAKTDPAKVDLWLRGVDTALFSPAKRSQALRDSWHVSSRRPALLYVGRVSKEKQLLMLPAVQDRLHALGVEHRFVFAGGGPLLSELQARMPEPCSRARSRASRRRGLCLGRPVHFPEPHRHRRECRPRSAGQRSPGRHLGNRRTAREHGGRTDRDGLSPDDPDEWASRDCRPCFGIRRVKRRCVSPHGSMR